MKLKTNNILFIQLFLMLFCQKIIAQENRVELAGLVKQDSILLVNINIINKATNTGAASDKDGIFTMNAKEGDSILISSINYINRIIKITSTHINNKKIEIYLEPDYNELDEIFLEKKNNLNWEKIAVEKGTILDNDKNTYKKPPTITTDPTYGNSGVNIIAVVFKIADELFFKKIRLKKKQKKQALKLKEENQLNFINNLVTNYSETFFVNELKIHPDKIYLFIEYCEDKGLKEHYKSNEIVVKNFLLTYSKQFNNIKP